MRTNNPNCNPMYFQEYDEKYELHEIHQESVIEDEPSFYDWFESKLRLYAENPLRLHLLKESYLKTLHYSIYMQSYGSPLTDHQMILQCNALYVRFCNQCRI